MATPNLTLLVRVTHAHGELIRLESVPPETTVAELVRQLLARLGLTRPEAGCRLLVDGLPLPPGTRVGDVRPSNGGPLELTLDWPGPMADDSDEFDLSLDDTRSGAVYRGIPGAAPSAPAAAGDIFETDFELAAAADEGEVDIDLAEVEELDAAEVAIGAAELSDKSPRMRRSVADDEVAYDLAPPPLTRRASVRHYSRMNPERVFPLVVVISKDVLARVEKSGTDQRVSKPFAVAAADPVTVEPVLPGCHCYPPSVTARLEGGELTATFRVAPWVLGRIDGASVVIRQDHAVLADVPLDIRVSKRAWVVASGALTFALPALSAALKHFGLDFATQKEQGFSVYLELARLVFDTSPLLLTLLLGAVTAAGWWLTRPKARDVFFDLDKVGPAEKLARVKELAAGDDTRGAVRELLELTKAFPDYQPACLYYAKWHADTGNDDAALKGYRKAFALGPAAAQDYHRASLAASRLQRNDEALAILERAERALPKLPAVLHFNKACYLCRLGRADEAVQNLRKAVAGGHTKADSYAADPDLAPLRGRADFRALLSGIVKSEG